MRNSQCYEYVQISQRQLKKAACRGHDCYRTDELSGSVEIEILVLTPVHIGSGYDDLTDDRRKIVTLNAFQQVSEQEKEYIIPGSSLKGAVRSIFEAITESCVRVTRCGIPNSVRPCNDLERLCIACRVFGAPGYVGRVAFEAASLKEGECKDVGIPQLYRPNCHRRGRKLYPHCHVKNGSIYKRCFAEGSILNFQIRFSNMSKAELGVLFIAMGVSPDYRFPIKIGGGKPVGWGSVALKINQAQQIILPGAQNNTIGRPIRRVEEDVEKFVVECCGQVGQMVQGGALNAIKNRVFDPAKLPQQAQKLWKQGG